MTADLHAPPLSLARPWGGTGWLTDVGAHSGPVHWVDFGGDEGGSDPRTPLVLVHGLGGSHLNWLLLAPLLRRHGRVYAVDLAGFGLTPRGTGSSAVWANVNLLHRFLRTVVGRPAVVVGNSMGGMVSLLLTATEPEVVERLVLLDPSIPTARRTVDRRVAATFALYSIPRVGEAFLGRVGARMTDRRRVQETTNLCFADPGKADPAVLDAGVELLAYRRQHVPDADASYLEAARSILRVLGRGGHYRELIRSVRRPVLLVHGDRDRLVPVVAARTAAADNPEWTSAILPGVGHVPMLEVPDHVGALVTEWLQDTPAASDRVLREGA